MIYTPLLGFGLFVLPEVWEFDDHFPQSGDNNRKQLLCNRPKHFKYVDSFISPAPCDLVTPPHSRGNADPTESSVKAVGTRVREEPGRPSLGRTVRLRGRRSEAGA